MSDLDSNDILNLEQARAYLKIGRNTILKLAAKGKIPAKKVGNSWRFSKRQLIKYIESGNNLVINHIQENDIKQVLVSGNNDKIKSPINKKKKIYTDDSFQNILNQVNKNKK